MELMQIDWPIFKAIFEPLTIGLVLTALAAWTWRKG